MSGVSDLSQAAVATRRIERSKSDRMPDRRSKRRTRRGPTIPGESAGCLGTAPQNPENRDAIAAAYPRALSPRRQALRLRSLGPGIVLVPILVVAEVRRDRGVGVGRGLDRRARVDAQR